MLDFNLLEVYNLEEDTIRSLTHILTHACMHESVIRSLNECDGNNVHKTSTNTGRKCEIHGESGFQFDEMVMTRSFDGGEGGV